MYLYNECTLTELCLCDIIPSGGVLWMIGKN